MSNSHIIFRGIAPIYSPLSLQLGVDQFSQRFIKKLKAINLEILSPENGELSSSELNGIFHKLGGEQSVENQYQSTRNNSKDVRLMCWAPSGRSDVLFHVFSNNIAIAEVEVKIDLSEFTELVDSSETLIELIEDKVQLLSKKQIALYFDDFCTDLSRLKPLLTDEFVYSLTIPEHNVNWVARTMLLDDKQLTQESLKRTLIAWLKKTRRPQDALDIISGDKALSMTWLNYVVKNAKPVGEDPNIQVMILAQYYYVSQENCNTSLRGAIELAYDHHKKKKSGKVLATTRTACRLNQIAFFENIKFLNQPNRMLLEDILTGWKFDQLVENSERMIEICDARLQEEDNKKREKSTIMTDFLLVGLSFFAVFELSLYLTEFSREMMSRPALDYNDSKSSYFLSVIAEIDVDVMFSLGFGLTLLLIIVYRFIKRS